MSAPDAIVISGVGMVSAVGPDAVRSCAVIRAGIARFAEWEGYFPEPPLAAEPDEDLVDPPLLAAPVPFAGGPGARRATLLRVALQDMIGSARLGRADFAGAGLFLALPEADRPGWEGAGPFVRAFFQGSAIPHPPLVKTFEAGHAAGLLALGQAVAALRTGGVERCIVAGTDSWLDPDAVAALDAAGRLKHDGNPSGRVPGEEASAVLIETAAAATARGAASLAAVGPVGAAEEPAREGDRPSDGAALTTAVRAACGPDGADPALTWAACDLNGERDRAREWGLVAVRLRGVLGEVAHLWHPADCRGDVGAAGATSLLVLGARALRRGYAPAGRCLVWAASDGGERAAVVLSAAAGANGEEGVRWA